MLQRLKTLPYRTYLLSTLLALMLFCVIGFFALPALTKSWLVPHLAQKIHRSVSLEKISFNPFSLQLRAQNLRISALADQHNLLTIDELYVNASAMSLLKLAPVLDEIRITHPVLHIVREAPHRFNVSDLIEQWQTQPPNPKPQRFSFNNIRVLDGSVYVDDQVLKQQHEIKNLKLQLPFLSNLPHATNIYVQPELSAVFNGAPLQAQAQTKPFKDNRESALKVKIDELNLLNYAALLPLPKDVQIEQGTWSSELQINFKMRPNAVPEVSIAGQAQIKQLTLSAPRTAVHLAQLQVQGLNAQPLIGQYQLSEIQLEQGQLFDTVWSKKTAIFQLGNAQITGIKANAEQRQLEIAAVTLDDAHTAVARNAQGQWNWQNWLINFSQTASSASTNRNSVATTQINSEAAASNWRGMVQSIALKKCGVSFHDAAVQPEVNSGVADVNATLRDVSLDPTQSLSFAVNLRVLPAGTLNAWGGLTPQPFNLALNVQAEHLPLFLGQAYWQDRVKLAVTEGQLNARGEVKLKAPSSENAAPALATAPLQFGYRGNLSLTQFRALEDASSEEFLRWNSLALNNIDLQNQKISVEAIALQNFFAKAVLDKNGQLNLAQLLVKPQTETMSGSASSATPAASETPSKPATLTSSSSTALPSAAPAASSSSFAVRIGGVRLQNGKVNFSDYFVRPNYQVNLNEVNGSVSAMSSLPTSVPAQVEVQAQVDGEAPVMINGALNLLAPSVLLDINASAKGIDLPTLTPYSAKYAGYAIEKGKLSMDLHYQIKDSALQASNHLFLDQLRFGEKIDSPSATKLPVQLAIALLKNSRGEIDINLPISGSLNDPQFSVSGLIVQVLVNLLMKAVTAPFSLLASLFGSADADWSQVSFIPGTATLTPDALKTLQGLGKALNDRPGLKLEITGHVNAALEQNALQENQLQQALLKEKRKNAKTSTASTQNPADAEQENSNAETITEAERANLIERIYANTGLPNKPHGVAAVTKKVSLEEMEANLLTHFSPNEETLRQLAIQRAQTARFYLTHEAKVSVERIFLLAPRVHLTAPEEEGKKPVCHSQCAEFSLR